MLLTWCCADCLGLQLVGIEARCASQMLDQSKRQRWRWRPTVIQTCFFAIVADLAGTSKARHISRMSQKPHVFVCRLLTPFL